MTTEKLAESIVMTMLAEDNEQALRLLYNRYHSKIYRLSLRYLKSSALAQEIVQDVFLKLWFERKNMKVEMPVEAWLITVAKNKLINQFKKMVNEKNSMESYSLYADQSVSEAEQKLLKSELENRIQETVNSLPLMQQQVYQYAKVEGLSYSDTAARLNISALTVKTHIARVMEKFRRILLKTEDHHS